MLRRRKGAVICAMKAIERASQSLVTTLASRSGAAAAEPVSRSLDFNSDLMFMKFSMVVVVDVRFLTMGSCGYHFTFI